MASTGVLMVGFSAIAPIISNLYKCSVVIVEAQTILFIIVYLPTNFIVIHLLNKYGLRITLIIGGIFLSVGAWLRILLIPFDNFGVVFFGTSVSAFSQACFLNSASKIASVWFGDRQRALATALSGLSIPFGSILGFIIPSLMISEADEAVPSEGKTKFVHYLIV
jgi:hypothetical protein